MSTKPNGLNQLTAAGGTTLGYDARGNLTSSGSSTYTYGQLNQLVNFPGGTLYYDSLMRLDLIYAASAHTALDYDGTNLATEYNYGTSAMLRRYVHGPGIDNPIVWYEGSGTSDRRFLMADERGSIVSVTDSAGATIAINRYDEYGIPGAGNIGRFGYTGQAWLAEVGLWYYKARMYSPTLGRFMQTDPIGYTDGMNWYNYVGSDPVNLVDPLGLADELIDPVPIDVKAIKAHINSTTSYGAMHDYSTFNFRPPDSNELIQEEDENAPQLTQVEIDNGLPRDITKLKKMLAEAKKQKDTRLAQRILKQLKVLGDRNRNKDNRGRPNTRGGGPRMGPLIIIPDILLQIYMREAVCREDPSNKMCVV